MFACYIYVYIYIYVRVCVYIYIYVCVCVCVCVCASVCVCIFYVAVKSIYTVQFYIDYLGQYINQYCNTISISINQFEIIRSLIFTTVFIIYMNKPSKYFSRNSYFYARFIIHDFWYFDVRGMTLNSIEPHSHVISDPGRCNLLGAHL